MPVSRSARALLALVAATFAVAAPAAQAATPAASGLGDQWALGTAHIADAWTLAGAGSASVLVGAVDSGVNLANPEVAGANLWTNAAEANGVAGVDDDHDGCVDDVHGCDFVNHDGDPTDDYGHGTATAGEVVSGWSGTYAGVAPASRLIVAKVLDGRGAGTTSQLAAGLDYVADQGAKVIVVSIGGTRSVDVAAAITTHPDTLFVVAAGNAGGDVDAGAAVSYPCADPAANVLCVAASTTADALASISNYGATSVDLAAPGQGIAAPTLTGTSTGWTGTSFAAPYVAGVAALAFAQQPSATVAAVKAAIVGSTDKVPALAGRTVSGGRLNAYRALRALAGDDPGQAAAAAPAATAPVASAPAAATPTAAVVPAVTAKAAKAKAAKAKKATKKTKKVKRAVRKAAKKAKTTKQRVSSRTARRQAAR
jgi:subtilisin family serine protease